MPVEALILVAFLGSHSRRFLLCPWLTIQHAKDRWNDVLVLDRQVHASIRHGCGRARHRSTSIHVCSVQRLRSSFRLQGTSIGLSAQIRYAYAPDGPAGMACPCTHVGADCLRVSWAGEKYNPTRVVSLQVGFIAVAANAWVHSGDKAMAQGYISFG